ncbi:High-affinity nicotinic acid transporter [Cytospora paraplurivora]|uniref:High-affinity nicotinic acid transporter n=1 Tax=Cytospora paraplurivora TaxID=2898453 RepID=A0AAN9TWW1_9PEZI
MQYPHGEVAKSTSIFPVEVESLSEAEIAKLQRKIDFRVLPMLFIIYVVAFLDRANISNALTMNMPKELGMTGQQPNIALAIFFVPYIIFEIPSNILMKRFTPHVWLSACMLGFGIFMLGQGFVQNYGSLLATRFFLGLFEAGIFPGSFYLISFWYKREESQKRFAIYFCSVIFASAFGGLLASGIAKMNGAGGESNWRWIFILEGILSILVAFAAFFFVSDFPSDAQWISKPEKQFVLKNTRAEETISEGRVRPRDIAEFFKDPKNYLGAVMYFVQTQLHSVPPFAAALGMCLLLAYMSDRSAYRLPYVLFPGVLLIAGLSVLMTTHGHFSAQYAAIFLVCMGAFGAGPTVICWYLMNLQGHKQRSIGSAWMISLGNTGGIVAPFTFLSRDSPYYHTGYSVCMGVVALGMVASLCYTALVLKERRKVQSGDNGVEDAHVRKRFISATIILLNFNVTLSSSLPSGAGTTLWRHFGVTSELQKTLPVAVFLVGYIGCGFAPNWQSFLFFRFMLGCAAAAPQTVSGGVFSDIYSDLRPRGMAVTMLGLTSNVGPLIGPIISGFTSISVWQWQFWCALMLAAVNWPMLLLMPETFAPVLNGYAKKADAMQTQVQPTMSAAILSRKSLVLFFGQHVRLLARPVRILSEPLVFFTDLFILYQYVIFFLYFGAYPIIFKGTYSMSDGVSALMFIPTGIGAVLAIVIFAAWDRFHQSSIEKARPWALQEEYRRLPLACLGGPLFGLSQFWLGWTARPSVHWAIPALSGIPLGIGIDLTFLALNNYLTDAYGIYSASALASSVFTRNVLAAVLIPLTTYPLYEDLGTDWACTLLGCMCLVLTPIPFVFIRWGPAMRKKSPFCQKLARMGDEGEDGNLGVPLEPHILG